MNLGISSGGVDELWRKSTFRVKGEGVPPALPETFGRAGKI